MYNEIELGNAMNVKITRIKNIGYVDFKLCFKAGLAFEQQNEYGITHLMEHMLFRKIGTLNYDELQNLYAKMGSEVFGKTGYDFLEFSFSVLSDNIQNALNYIKELFILPNWTKDDLENEKKIIIHEINLKGNRFSKQVNYVFDNELLKKSVMGSISSVKSISLKKLCSYYNDIITPENAMLFVAGDISTEKSNSLLESLSLIDNKNILISHNQKSLLPQSICSRKNNYLLVYDYYDYSDLVVSFDIGSSDQYVSRFINFYLSGYTSPLSQSIVDDKSLTYELETNLDEWNNFSILSFEIFCNYNRLAETIIELAVSLRSAIDKFNRKLYDEICSYIILENTKNNNNPHSVNELKFKEMYYGIANKIPTYDEVIDSMNNIFIKKNLSIFSTYSCKKSIVDAAIKIFLSHFEN